MDANRLMGDDPQWTTIDNAADRIGKSRRTVWRLIEKHRIATAHEYGFTLVDMQELRHAVNRG